VLLLSARWPGATRPRWPIYYAHIGEVTSKLALTALSLVHKQAHRFAPVYCLLDEWVCCCAIAKVRGSAPLPTAHCRLVSCFCGRQERRHLGYSSLPIYFSGVLIQAGNEHPWLSGEQLLSREVNEGSCRVTY